MFAMARSGEFKIQGFPAFDATLADLKQFQRCPKPDYSVCVASGNALIIREALVQFWVTKHPEFADQMQELVKVHDQEFNPKNLKRGLEQEGDSEPPQESPAKKLRLTQAKTMEELEKEHSERSLFTFQSLRLGILWFSNIPRTYSSINIVLHKEIYVKTYKPSINMSCFWILLY